MPQSYFLQTAMVSSISADSTSCHAMHMTHNSLCVAHCTQPLPPLLLLLALAMHNLNHATISCITHTVGLLAINSWCATGQCIACSAAAAAALGVTATGGGPAAGSTAAAMCGGSTLPAAAKIAPVVLPFVANSKDQQDSLHVGCFK